MLNFSWKFQYMLQVYVTLFFPYLLFPTEVLNICTGYAEDYC